MERRGFLKGLLGTGAGVVLGHKVLTDSDAKALNSGLTTIEETIGGTVIPESRPLEAVISSTSSVLYNTMRPLGYYRPGDELIKLRAAENIEVGSIVAINKNMEVVKRNKKAPPDDPAGISLGVAISSATSSGTCVVQVRDSNGWVAVHQ